MNDATQDAAPVWWVRGFTRQFGSTRALDQVEFDIRSGEILGLIGPNGSGKTTLLHSLAGLEPADAGRFHRGDRPLTAAALRDVLWFLPEGIAPWEGQRVDAVIGFFASLHDAPTARRDALIAALDTAVLLGQDMDTLSRGQRKRVLLVLALLTPHPLLLLDEPFEGLDLRQTRQITALLRQEAATGRTLLLSMHQMADAVRLCDRLVLLHAGRVAGVGSLEELALKAGMPGAPLEEIALALA